MPKDAVSQDGSITKAEFDKLAEDMRYYLWVMGDIPQDWYTEDDWKNYGKARAYTPSPTPTVTTKREPTIWRPKGSTLNTRSSYTPYEPFDATHNTLLKVEDAIRAVNPALAQTHRLITK